MTRRLFQLPACAFEKTLARNGMYFLTHPKRKVLSSIMIEKQVLLSLRIAGVHIQQRNSLPSCSHIFPWWMFILNQLLGLLPELMVHVSTQRISFAWTYCAVNITAISCLNLEIFCNIIGPHLASRHQTGFYKYFHDNEASLIISEFKWAARLGTKSHEQ